MKTESPRFAAGPVFAAAVALIGLLGILAIGLAFFQAAQTRGPYRREKPAAVTPREQAEFESGRLVTDLHERQARILNGYGDDETDDAFVRVPIGRAIDDVLGEAGSSSPESGR